MPTFPKIELPKFELPKFEAPTFDDLPKIELPEVPSVEDVVGCARNAVYVGVGLAVTTVERLQALSTQLVDNVRDGVSKARKAA
jgi:hypothetical protein